MHSWAVMGAPGEIYVKRRRDEAGFKNFEVPCEPRWEIEIANRPTFVVCRIPFFALKEREGSTDERNRFGRGFAMAHDHINP